MKRFFSHLVVALYALLSVIEAMAQEPKQKYDVAAFLYPAYASDDVRLDHSGLQALASGRQL